MSPRGVVERFWQLMASNDFQRTAEVLAADFVLEWPQSGERIRGAERFARMNQEYPAHGSWRFDVRRMVAGDAEVVKEVDVTDGVQTTRAVSFFTIENGRIVRIVEYWPEAYAAPENRAHLVERMDVI